MQGSLFYTAKTATGPEHCRNHRCACFGLDNTKLNLDSC